MDIKQKKQLGKVFDVSLKMNIEEILDKKISHFGSGAHVVLPLRHVGKKAKIMIYK